MARAYDLRMMQRAWLPYACTALSSAIELTIEWNAAGERFWAVKRTCFGRRRCGERRCDDCDLGTAAWNHERTDLGTNVSMAAPLDKIDHIRWHDEQRIKLALGDKNLLSTVPAYACRHISVQEIVRTSCSTAVR